ncbi:MAG TPA: hypothetical protein VHO91_04575 [Rhodopila sp.]|nr:hypothetical protein [Rhodopila sp.]
MDTDNQVDTPDPAIQALGLAMSKASEEQIMRAVDVIESLADRGAADQVIAPVRARLRKMNPPRRLRFHRLLLHPLDVLIVPPTQWRYDEPALPRTGLLRMAHHVQRAMGAEAQAIEEQLVGWTADDAALIERLGNQLWPAAATILANDPVAGLAEEVGRRNQHQLAQIVSVLLQEAPRTNALIAETANGLLPPRLETLDAMIGRIVAKQEAALPMFLTLLLVRVPQAVTILDDLKPGHHLSLVRSARSKAMATLLRRLHRDIEIEAQVNTGSLTDAASVTRRMSLFLNQFSDGRDGRDWREPVQALRRRLATACQSRFNEDLDQGLLGPMTQGEPPPGSDTIIALESVARGLRLLEDAARGVGGSSGYDARLREVSAMIGAGKVGQTLSLAERARLVEILSGPEAALALLDRR